MAVEEKDDKNYYVVHKGLELIGPFNKEDGEIWSLKANRCSREYNVNKCILSKIPKIYFDLTFQELIAPPDIPNITKNRLYAVSKDFEIIGSFSKEDGKEFVNRNNIGCRIHNDWLLFHIFDELLNTPIKDFLHEPYEIEGDDYL